MTGSIKGAHKEAIRYNKSNKSKCKIDSGPGLMGADDVDWRGQGRGIDDRRGGASNQINSTPMHAVHSFSGAFSIYPKPLRRTIGTWTFRTSQPSGRS